MIKRLVASAILATSFVAVHPIEAQQKVLAEMFTNTNCGNCKVPEEAYDAFVSAHPEFGIVRVVYHNEVTNTDDVFYVPAMGDVNAREQSYGLSANPLGVIDGFVLGNNESTWESTTSAAASQAFPVSVAVTTASIGSNKYSVHVELTGTLTKQVKLFAALTESGIIYDNSFAYGNPTSGHWDDIFRAMLPGSTGTDAFIVSGTKSFDFTADLTDQDWNPANMHVVAFLQDVSGNGGKQVEGLASVALSGTGGVSESTSTQGVTATPAGLRISLGETSDVSLSIRDILGRQISQESYARLAPGVHTLDERGLRSGVYFVTVVTNGKPLGCCKIVR